MATRKKYVARARGRMTPERFKAWRLRMGYEMPQAAEALGVELRAVYRYETGERSISRTVAILCDAIEQLRELA